MRTHRATVHPALVLLFSCSSSAGRRRLSTATRPWPSPRLATRWPSTSCLSGKRGARAVSCGACSSRGVFRRRAGHMLGWRPAVPAWQLGSTDSPPPGCWMSCFVGPCVPQALIVHCTLLCALRNAVQARACVPGSGPPAGGPGRFRGVRGGSRGGWQHPAQAEGRQVSGHPALHRAACRFA